MLITIADVLTADQVAGARLKLAAAEWTDGRVTAGYQAQEVKRNAQISEGSPVAREVGDIILAGLARSPLFMSAALPLRVFPPMFNSYSGGQTFGTIHSKQPPESPCNRAHPHQIHPPRSHHLRSAGRGAVHLRAVHALPANADGAGRARFGESR